MPEFSVELAEAAIDLAECISRQHVRRGGGGVFVSGVDVGSDEFSITFSLSGDNEEAHEYVTEMLRGAVKDGEVTA